MEKYYALNKKDVILLCIVLIQGKCEISAS